MTKIIPITSAQNAQLKRWKKLLTKKGRTREKSLLIEGEHLLLEAVRSQRIQVRNIILRENIYERLTDDFRNLISSYPIYILPRSLFQLVAETEETQGVMAEVKTPEQMDDEKTGLKDAVYLLIDRVQDPGNLGTILRTAQAVGVTKVYLGKGTVDPYNGKVVRSSMGAIFHVPFQQVDLYQVIPRLKNSGVSVIGTSLTAEKEYDEAEYRQSCAILLGNEGKGVATDLQAMVEQAVRIPMPGGTESLNVAVAGALLMYEVHRQRKKR